MSNSISSTQPLDPISTIDLTPEQTQKVGVVVQQRETAAVRSTDLVPQRSGLLATAHTPSGDAVMGDLTPETLIRVGNVPMRLRDAERYGYVKRDAQGNYVEATADVQVSAEERERLQREAQDKEAQFPEPVNEEMRGFLGALHDGLQEIGASPREAMLQFFADPEAFQQRYVRNLVGGDPEAERDMMLAMAQTLKAGLRQVQGLAAQEGVIWDEVDQYLEQRPTEWKAAALAALDGDARPFRRLIARFKVERPNHRRPLPEGLKTRKTTDGTEYVRVRLPNRREIEVSVANARMQGWIK